MKIIALILITVFLSFYNPIFVYGVNTHSADFERDTPSQYFSAADSTDNSVTGDISIELWFKREGPTAVKMGLVGKEGDATGDWRSYELYFFTDDKIYFNYNDTGTPGNWTEEATDNNYSTTGVWTHLAVTAVVATQDVNFYINGSAVASTLNSSAGSSIFDNNKTFEIGYYDQYFDGLIDEVRVWSDVRTATEISNNYQTTLNGNEANLVAYYMFDGSSLEDKGTGTDPAGAIADDLTNNNSVVFVTDVPFPVAAAAIIPQKSEIIIFE